MAARPQALDEIRQQSADPPVADHADRNDIVGTRQMPSHQSIGNAEHEPARTRRQQHFVRLRACAECEVARQQLRIALALPVEAGAFELQHEEERRFLRAAYLRERVTDRGGLGTYLRKAQAADLGAGEACGKRCQIDRV